jgi:hypothetical protein
MSQERLKTKFAAAASLAVTVTVAVLNVRLGVEALQQVDVNLGLQKIHAFC